MSTLDQQPEDLSPQRNLPPVQPPTAGFIVQLFVIPALVVLVIVLVWLLFNWLAHMGGNPASYLAAMKAGRGNSWQQAYNLAEELQRNEAARNDPELAKDVAAFLDARLSQPLPAAEPQKKHKRDLRSEEAKLRGFLCQALGHFRVTEHTVPVLLKAAAPSQEKDESAQVVRVAALQALAVLADNVRTSAPLNDPRVIDTFVRASRDDEPIIADAGTFGLGVVGGPEAIKRLQAIVKEARAADVQYNAALGLARHGDASGWVLIVEMIDPGVQRGLEDPEDQKGLGRAAKKARLQLNGLRAAKQLHAAGADVDKPSLVAAVKRLEDSKAPDVVQSEAKALMRELPQ